MGRPVTLNATNRREGMEKAPVSGADTGAAGTRRGAFGRAARKSRPPAAPEVTQSGYFGGRAFSAAWKMRCTSLSVRIFGRRRRYARARLPA